MAKKKSNSNRNSDNRGGRASFFQLTGRDFAPLLIAISLSIILRAIYLWELSDSIFYGNYILDSRVIDVWAMKIVDGPFWGTETFFRAPLYPYIVALLYSIFGHAPAPVLIFQLLIGTLTVALTYFYARYLFGQSVATLAGIIAACWPTLIYFDGELMITALVVFLSLCSLAALHVALHSGKVTHYVLAGIALGLAAISKPTVLPIILIIPIYHLLRGGADKYQRTLKLGAVYAGAALLCILPVTVRNLVVADDPVLISSQGGANFYVGNSVYADGITVQMPRADAIFEGGLFDDNIHSQSVSVAQKALGRNLKDSEVSSYWYSQTFREMFDAPGRAIGLMLKKAYYFFHGQEIFNNKSLYFAGEYSTLMRISLWKQGPLNFPSGLLFPLMFAGIVLAVRSRKETLVPLSYVAIYFAVVIAYFVCARFRQPIIPVAIIFASYGIVETMRLFRAQKSGRTLPIIVFLISLILLNLGGDIESVRNRSQDLNIVGTAYVQRGENEKAIEYLSRSLELAPGNGSAIGSLARAYVQSNNPGEAVRTLKKGLEVFPNEPSLYYNLGVIYVNHSKFEEAKYCFYKTMDLDPTWPAPFSAMKSIYEYEGVADSAAIMQAEIERLPQR